MKLMKLNGVNSFGLSRRQFLRGTSAGLARFPVLPGRVPPGVPQPPPHARLNARADAATADLTPPYPEGRSW